MTKLSAAALLALCSTASAQSVVATDEPHKPAHTAIDGRLGMLLGGSDVGDADGFSMGVSAALGYRINDVTLRGLFDYYRVGDNPDETLARKGRATRVGGAVRYSFANNGPDAKLGVDFWGELGAGLEHVAWRQGGVLDRFSADAAVGFDLGGRSDRDDHGHRREIGYFMAFRTIIGEAPEMPGAMATCGGPCSEATTPPRTDITMFFELGVHWAR